jgi:hypothetical protein
LHDEAFWGRLMVTRKSPNPEPQEVSGSRGPSITRRRSLPTGRAVVGALLVTLAAIGLFVAYRQAVGEPDTGYLVLEHRVEAGQRVTDADLRLEKIELPDSMTPTVFNDAAAVIGAVAIVPLRMGELLQRGDVLLLAPGELPEDPPWREFSFSIARSRALDGQIRSGEIIDLLATYSVNANTDTVVVFRNAPVLRVTDVSEGILSSTGGVTITAALTDPSTVLAAVNAIDDAKELTVIRATKASDQELPNSFQFDDSPTDVPTAQDRPWLTAMCCSAWPTLDHPGFEMSDDGRTPLPFRQSS